MLSRDGSEYIAISISGHIQERTGMLQVVESCFDGVLLLVEWLSNIVISQQCLQRVLAQSSARLDQETLSHYRIADSFWMILSPSTCCLSMQTCSFRRSMTIPQPSCITSLRRFEAITGLATNGCTSASAHHNPLVLFAT
jgi:hypothetical protein